MLFCIPSPRISKNSTQNEIDTTESTFNSTFYVQIKQAAQKHRQYGARRKSQNKNVILWYIVYATEEKKTSNVILTN